MSTIAGTSDHIQLPGNPGGDQDDLLYLAAANALRLSNYGLVRKLQCEVAAGVVTLFGVVPSYFLKQVAQETVLRLDRLRGVNNLVEVRKTDFMTPLDLDEEPWQVVEEGVGA